ncbi:MAG: 2-C-methyl-D-erythritol 4-phosphate cytidylyltransferase [Acutalibacteraceae bacterium]
MQRKTAAIIVAGGDSTRMGELSKQFIKLCGKEVILRTALAFQHTECIDEIIVVCREQDDEKMRALLTARQIPKLKGLVRGGATRQQSVQNGISLVSGDAGYIAVHDGARPLVTEELITRTVENAHRYGASAPGVPVKDTIKTVASDGMITGTPNRSSLYAIQTPQVFEKILYLRAMEAANTIGAGYTDDCALVEAADHPVYVTQGEYTNLKITTPDDIPAAQAIIMQREKNGIGGFRG